MNNIHHLTPVTQGTHWDERIGSKIWLKSLKMSLSLGITPTNGWSAANTNTNWYWRVVIIQWKLKANQPQVGMMDDYTNGNPFHLQNIGAFFSSQNNIVRYNILHDKVYTIKPLDSLGPRFVRIRIKKGLKRNLEYSDHSPYPLNGLYALIIPGNYEFSATFEEPADFPRFYMNWKVSFVDM